MIGLFLLKYAAEDPTATMVAVRSILAGAGRPVPVAPPVGPPPPVVQPYQPLHVRELYDYVHANAPAYRLDPAAMLAVAEQEGLGGRIGDDGLAYGPWQDHITEFNRAPFTGPIRNNASVQAWAWSPAGVDYVMRAMRASGVSGLTGYDAVYAIVYHYERPREDLRAGEVARAWANYNKWKG